MADRVSLKCSTLDLSEPIASPLGEFKLKTVGKRLQIDKEWPQDQEIDTEKASRGVQEGA